jgi:hypothetical protein
MKEYTHLRIIFPILIIAIITTILFWKFFIFGYIPIASDFLIFECSPWRLLHGSGKIKNFLLSDPITLFYPFNTIIYEYLKDFKIPLWNPYIFCGTPYTDPFPIPFSILLYLGLIFSLPIAYSFIIILQVFLAGVFMFLYLKNLGLTSFGSLVGAIVFMLNGVFAVWLEFTTTIGGCLWFPLIFLLIDKTISKKSFLYSSLTAIFISLHFFSSHLQFAAYLLISAPVYAFFRSFWLYTKEKSNKNFIKSIFLILISFIFGIFLASVYLLPLYNKISFSHRQDVKFEELNPLPVANLITFIIPDFYGTPASPNPALLNSYRIIRSWFYNNGWIKMRPIKVGGENYNEYCGYIGILPLILALLAGLLKKDKNTRFFFGFWIISLLLALGTFLYLPLYWFVPGFNKIGISRIIFLFCFAGAILAGIGAEYLTEIKNERCKMKNVKWIIKIIIWIVCIATIGLIIFLLLPKFSKGNLTSQILAWHFSLKNPSMYIPVLLLFSILILISSLKIHNLQFVTFPNTFLKGAILLVVSFDLLYFGMKYNPMTPKEWLFPQTPSLNFLTAKLKEESPFRIVAFHDILPSNTNLVYRLQSVEGYESLHSARYHDFMRGLVSRDVGHNWIDIINIKANRKLLDLLNAKYVLSKYKLPGKDLKLVYDKEIKIYQDLQALPRAWIVPEVKILKTKEEIFKELISPEFDPWKTVILEEEIKMQKTKEKEKIKESFPIPKIVKYQPEKVIIETTLAKDGFLVLSDSYYPGWKVFVDGKEDKILKANYIMRAVKLNKGHHKIEFIYDPLSFKLGLIISLSTFLFIIILLISILLRSFCKIYKA